MSKYIENLDAILANVDALMEKRSRREICEKIVEYAGFLEPYDHHIDRVFEVLEKYCGGAYIAKLKQTLRMRLMAYGSPISPEIISIMGTQVAYVIHEVFNPRLPLMLTKNVILKFAKEYGISKSVEISFTGELAKYNEAIAIGDIYTLLLEKFGAFELPNFAEEYSKSFKSMGEKLSTEKSIVASIPLFYCVGTNTKIFDVVVNSISRNFDATYGFCIAAGYALMRYLGLKGVRYFTWNILLKTLDYTDQEALQLYQKARKNDPSLIFDILSKMISKYYRGPVSSLIYAVTKGITSTKSAVALLLSTSYTTSSMANLQEILEFVYKMLNKHWGKEPNIDTYVFKIMDKIASEARPVVIRRFLEMDGTRRRIIEILTNYPSTLIFQAFNRLIKAYIPYEVAKRLSVESEIHIDVKKLEKNMPNWRRYMDLKTLTYLGVLDIERSEK